MRLRTTVTRGHALGHAPMLLKKGFDAVLGDVLGDVLDAQPARENHAADSMQRRRFCERQVGSALLPCGAKVTRASSHREDGIAPASVDIGPATATIREGRASRLRLQTSLQRDDAIWSSLVVTHRQPTRRFMSAYSLALAN